MPAINFSMFVDKVLSGEKKQTIRKVRKNPIKVGDTLQLYTCQRTKDCRKLGEAVCVDIQDVHIDYSSRSWIASGYKCNGTFDESLDVFAKQDGFDNFGDMCSFLRETYGLPFEGVIIKWDDFEPEGR